MTLRLPAAALLGVLAVLAAGCGGEEEPEVSPAAPQGPNGNLSGPAQALPCPAEGFRGEAPGDPLDTRELLGMRLEAAQRLAARHGCVVRVVRRDGEALAGTTDFRLDRVNVATRDGVVVELRDVR